MAYFSTLSGSADQKNGVPILSDNNYSEWDAAIRAFFLYIGFPDSVDGDLNAPSEATPELLMKYKKLTKKAARAICKSLDTNNRAKFLNKSNERIPRSCMIPSLPIINQTQARIKLECSETYLQ
ncbi:hypothetical protein O181_105565 [Austropuccinia psidii MF-1]|uniref:Uncharacterized protein n=1 Tax=Austropuccinia psidii MF-1 TaxID=1389203 RepID=A0A9Q3PLS1_9BASI|nr:hypothetical protein [Austropuccinia psidii MF-1]